MTKREMDIKRPTSNFEQWTQTWKSAGLTEKRKGCTWKRVFPIWCSQFVPGSDVGITYRVHTVYQEWCQVWYMGYQLVLRRALGGTRSLFCGWNSRLFCLSLSAFFLYSVWLQYIHILFISEDRDLCLCPLLYVPCVVHGTLVALSN